VRLRFAASSSVSFKRIWYSSSRIWMSSLLNCSSHCSMSDMNVFICCQVCLKGCLFHMMRVSLTEYSVQDLIYQVTLLLNWESTTGLLLEVVIDWVDKYRLIQGKINQNKLPMLNFPSIGRKTDRKLTLTNIFLPVSTGICRQPVFVPLYSTISSSSKKNR